MMEMTDHEIVELVKSGDRKAFSILVRRHQKSLLRVCLRFVKDLETAEDVVQESFIKAFERLHSFEARSAFKSWLFQIAINTAKNKLRDRRSDMVDIENVPLAVNPMAEMRLVAGSVSDIIAMHVEKLPIKQRTALMLRVYEDLSFKEIAEIMECPYDTAKANYRHGLMRLKAELENHEDLKQWSEDVGGVFMDMAQRAAEAES